MTTDAREALHCEGCNGYVTLLEGTDLARDCPGWPERESAIRAEERQRANSTWTTNSGGVGATPTEAMAALREALADARATLDHIEADAAHRINALDALDATEAER